MIRQCFATLNHEYSLSSPRLTDRPDLLDDESGGEVARAERGTVKTPHAAWYVIVHILCIAFASAATGLRFQVVGYY